MSFITSENDDPDEFVAAEETPVAVEETPVAAEETPVAAEKTPVAVEETPAATEKTPGVDSGEDRLKNRFGIKRSASSVYAQVTLRYPPPILRSGRCGIAAPTPFLDRSPITSKRA